MNETRLALISTCAAAGLGCCCALAELHIELNFNSIELSNWAAEAALYCAETTTEKRLV
jgi:hypothetical protein